MKICSLCKVSKDFVDFYKDISKTGGVSSRCKSCVNASHKAKRSPSVCPYCGKQHYTKGGRVYCSLHCALWDRINKENEQSCWEWTGLKNELGYGIFVFTSKHYLATRALMVVLGHNIEGLLVCHKCDNPSCCNPRHLFLGTDMDNCKDKIIKGRANIRKGESNGCSKLKGYEVLEIKSLLGTMTMTAIALKYGVTKTTISGIARGRAWKHII